MQKAISPLVATVILIAVTMTIAGLLAFWASSFTKTSLPSKNKTQTLQQCAGADFVIYYQQEANNTLTLVLQNTGTSGITITNVTFLYPDGSLETKSIDKVLPEASLKSFKLYNVTPGWKSYTIFTSCPNVYRRYP